MTDERGVKLLEEAANLVAGERQKAYGHPSDNFRRICAMWNAVLDRKLKEPITTRDHALMMICVKLAREAEAPKRDNLVDVCGYAATAEMCVSPVPESAPHSGTTGAGLTTEEVGAFRKLARAAKRLREVQERAGRKITMPTEAK